MDVDDIGLGSFPDKLANAVNKANVMLVVIGPGWADIADEQGNRRLENPEDWVRRENRMGIEKKALIVPVLFSEEPMPAADSLPRDIRPLASFQAVPIKNNAWKRDFAHLVDLLAHNFGRTMYESSANTDVQDTMPARPS